jgi:prephenate dehydrogenase
MWSRILFYGSGLMARKLGLLAARAGLEVLFYDRDVERAREASRSVGGRSIAGLQGYTRGSVVVVAVPGPAAGEALRRIVELAGAEAPAAVTDISTFKLGLMGVYGRLPPGVIACPIHPLFGPRAGRAWVHWTAVIPVPGREGDCRGFTPLLDRLGLRHFTVDPVTHDRLVGLTIGVSYALGLALAYRASTLSLEQGVLERHMGTTYRLLHLLSEAIGSDAEHLILEIVGNENTRRALEELIGVLEEILSNPKRVLEASRARRALCRDPYGAVYDIVEDVIPRRCGGAASG